MIDCKKYADEILDEIKRGVESGEIKGSLAVISVVDDEASKIYIKGKKKDCERVGFEFAEYHFAEDADKIDILRKIYELNDDKTVTGIIVQLPLPAILEPHKRLILDSIRPDKDVDGFNRFEPVYKPCTPEGIIYILKKELGSLEDKNVTILGRGYLVGKPLAKMLLEENANVTVCHSHTSIWNIHNLTSYADVIISAVGIPERWIGLEFGANHSAIIIDCGVHRLESGRIVGDCVCDNYCNKTPVPGGVGLLTRAMLIKHVARNVGE